jgi:hypothetical protein
MRKIIGNCIGHNLTKISKTSDFICIACATEKLILRPSPFKIHTEPLKFIERIQGDICGPIQPISGPFRYFMVLIDTSTRWSHVCLLSTRNHTFAKIMAQVIRLKANFSEHWIQSIRLDNAAELLSRAFNNYCRAQGILVQCFVPYVHTQNCLAKSLIKRIMFIARPLLHNCNFYVNLHACRPCHQEQFLFWEWELILLQLILKNRWLSLMVHTFQNLEDFEVNSRFRNSSTLRVSYTCD